MKVESLALAYASKEIFPLGKCNKKLEDLFTILKTFQYQWICNHFNKIYVDKQFWFYEIALPTKKRKKKILNPDGLLHQSWLLYSCIL